MLFANYHIFFLVAINFFAINTIKKTSNEKQQIIQLNLHIES